MAHATRAGRGGDAGAASISIHSGVGRILFRIGDTIRGTVAWWLGRATGEAKIWERAPIGGLFPLGVLGFHQLVFIIPPAPQKFYENFEKTNRFRLLKFKTKSYEK